MLKLKWITLSLALLLFLSLAMNARLYVLWISAHDDVYEMVHKMYKNDQLILSELKSGNISEANNILLQEIEINGSIINICEIKKCSKAIIGASNESP